MRSVCGCSDDDSLVVKDGLSLLPWLEVADAGDDRGFIVQRDVGES